MVELAEFVPQQLSQDAYSSTISYMSRFYKNTVGQTQLTYVANIKHAVSLLCQPTYADTSGSPCYFHHREATKTLSAQQAGGLAVSFAFAPQGIIRGLVLSADEHEAHATM
jgi:hypothetical protein